MYEEIISMWQAFSIESISDYEKYLGNFKILFAYHSGKIENEAITYHDTREVFEHGKVINFSGSPRTLFETQNQKICYEFLLAHLQNRTPLSLQLIKEVHRVLTEGTYDERRYIENGERPGEFKKGDYITGRHEVGSSAEHVAEDLEELMLELSGFVGKITPGNALTAAAYFHAAFENIHPFADGNGRVGRTLLNYFLMLHDHPPLIIYEENKQFYYEALEVFDEIGEIQPLKEFFKYQVERTWEKQLALSKGERPKRSRMKL
ncbi:MAG: Fic family protein [Turicibacter sp.]|nr:Fic family protein [Turicibacter sp.]